MSISDKPKNLLIIMSDEHNPKMLGCEGHPIIETPNLDALAARGVRFSSAYCASPVCIPSRASFATGKYIHQVGHWDNADAYDGEASSWHHVLRGQGHEVVSIGKLHFKSDQEDHGFSKEVIPMHIVEGKGDLMGLVRTRPLPVRKGAYKMAGMAGPGESQYTYYDREIAARAQVWLREEAVRHTDKPWALFVSFVAPHFPLTAPPEHYYKYFDQDLPLPKLHRKELRPTHPYLQDYRNSFNYDDYFDEKKLKVGLAGYYGLCSFLDENVGAVLKALEDAGLAEDTRIMYTSDHGDNLGTRGMWGKSNMYEEVARVPLIVAGPDIPAGKVVDTHTSHVDTYPFILDCVGAAEPEPDADRPGVSLERLIAGEQVDRNVLVEYHGMGSTSAAFMIRHQQYKYVHYVDYAPQLFDLGADPEELNDMSEDPAYREILAECRRRLFAVCDPAEVDRRARKRQAELLAANGGADAVIARGDLGFSPAPGAPKSFD